MEIQVAGYCVQVTENIYPDDWYVAITPDDGVGDPEQIIGGFDNPDDARAAGLDYVRSITPAYTHE